MKIEKNMFSPANLHTESFISEFREELKGLLKMYPTPADFIREKLGVNDIMEKDFPTLENVSDKDIIFDMSRGNPALSNKSVLTPNEAESLISEAINVSFK